MVDSRSKGTKKYRFQWTPCPGPKVTRSREYRRKRHSGTTRGPPVDRLSSLKVISRWCASLSTRGPKAKPLERQEWGPMAILNRGVYKPSVRVLYGCHSAVRSPIYLCVNKAIRRSKRDYSSLSLQIGLLERRRGIDDWGDRFHFNPIVMSKIFECTTTLLDREERVENAEEARWG